MFSSRSGYVLESLQLEGSLTEVFSQHEEITIRIQNNNFSFTSFSVTIPSPYFPRTGVDRHSQILQAVDDWID